MHITKEFMDFLISGTSDGSIVWDHKRTENIHREPFSRYTTMKNGVLVTVHRHDTDDASIAVSNVKKVGDKSVRTNLGSFTSDKFIPSLLLLVSRIETATNTDNPVLVAQNRFMGKE